jgi:hypothetical protein
LQSHAVSPFGGMHETHKRVVLRSDSSIVDRVLQFRVHGTAPSFASGYARSCARILALSFYCSESSESCVGKRAPYPTRLHDHDLGARTVRTARSSRWVPSGSATASPGFSPSSTGSGTAIRSRWAHPLHGSAARVPFSSTPGTGRPSSRHSRTRRARIGEPRICRRPLRRSDRSAW